MKKLKIIQFGINHEHAPGKYASLKKLPDLYEIVGVVDDSHLKSPSMPYNPDVYKDAEFISVEAALKFKGLDAVCVEVPNLKLVEYAMEFARRGIPMHMDKPAGERLEPYKKLLALCKRQNVPLQMGYMYRGNPALNFIQKLIREKVIGEIFEARLDMNHKYGGDLYQQYMGKFKGGIMFNLGCHLIDFVIAAMGKPDEITPFLKNTPDVNKNIKNNSLAVMEYQYGTVMLRACSKVPGCVSMRTWNFIGSNGSIWVNPPERFDGKPVEVHIKLESATEHYPAGETVISFPPQHDRYTEQLKELAAVIRGERKPVYSYEHDYLVHKATLAASGYIDWKTGKKIK